MTDFYHMHKKMWCRIGGITFPSANTVALHIQQGDCSDMTGAIDYAKRASIDLDGFYLENVHIFSSGRLNTVYSKFKDGRWRAFEP